MKYCSNFKLCWSCGFAEKAITRTEINLTVIKVSWLLCFLFGNDHTGQYEKMTKLWSKLVTNYFLKSVEQVLRRSISSMYVNIPQLIGLLRNPAVNIIYFDIHIMLTFFVESEWNWACLLYLMLVVSVRRSKEGTIMLKSKIVKSWNSPHRKTRKYSVCLKYLVMSYNWALSWEWLKNWTIKLLPCSGAILGIGLMCLLSKWYLKV